jgi:THO complex subunit 4
MWLHDKAPGAPRAANQSNGHTKPEASLNSKLLVSNLHYEITTKDLIVRLEHYIPSNNPYRGDLLQAIFGQIGTLVREPIIRVRTSEYTEFT